MIIYGVSKGGRIHRNEQPVYVPTDKRPIGSKACSVCHEVKDVSSFHRDSNAKSGYRSSCKECYRKLYQERREHMRGGADDTQA